MVWSAIVSAALHLAIVSLFLYALARLVITPKGNGEQVSETTTISIEVRPSPKPAPKQRIRRAHVQAQAASSAPTRHEIAKEVAAAPVQPRRIPHIPAVSSIERDRTSFANEVARLNARSDPHAIPTIDPAQAQSSSKTYAFDAARSSEGGAHGNGIITPIQSWQDHGLDCYYARYEYTYASGASEEGRIAWPVCFEPASDPFHEPPHPMPFPLPQPGYALPPGTEMPPLEKQVYDEWISSH
ncbi:MAG: hypothetical protein JOY69_01885 [Candidatus Eremiobacteraeota bacterium]|nr:hypothetical protein [Candidatus Eremiobacteraeota bacterium]